MRAVSRADYLCEPGSRGTHIGTQCCIACFTTQARNWELTFCAESLPAHKGVEKQGFLRKAASILELYSAFHKLSMLNDLAIPKTTRERFRKEVAARLALRLPEPQDEEKVFRFERVNFFAQDDGEIVDYVSLSDGEHQLAQILGMFGMVSLSNALFLLDEPESHFNPQWCVKFMTHVLD